MMRVTREQLREIIEYEHQLNENISINETIGDFLTLAGKRHKAKKKILKSKNRQDVRDGIDYFLSYWGSNWRGKYGDDVFDPKAKYHEDSVERLGKQIHTLSGELLGAEKLARAAPKFDPNKFDVMAPWRIKEIVSHIKRRNVPNRGVLFDNIWKLLSSLYTTPALTTADLSSGVFTA